LILKIIYYNSYKMRVDFDRVKHKIMAKPNLSNKKELYSPKTI